MDFYLHYFDNKNALLERIKIMISCLKTTSIQMETRARTCGKFRKNGKESLGTLWLVSGTAKRRKGKKEQFGGQNPADTQEVQRLRTERTG